MKSSSLTMMLMAGIVQVASAQSGAVSPTIQERRAVELEMQAALVGQGSLRARVEAKVTRGAPYSADAVTEFTQQLADGNRIERRSVTRTFRDSDGRMRRETLNEAGEVTRITISDPVAGTSFTLDPATRTARQMRLVVPSTVLRPAGRGGGRGGAAAPQPAAGQEERRRVAELREHLEGAAAGAVGTRERGRAGATTEENLGTRLIEGVMADGIRRTTVIAAGAVGNVQPITMATEEWFSPDLQVLVQTRHSDPRTGETVYRLTNIIRGEPDRSLFEVPADYTIK